MRHGCSRRVCIWAEWAASAKGVTRRVQWERCCWNLTRALSGAPPCVSDSHVGRIECHPRRRHASNKCLLAYNTHIIHSDRCERGGGRHLSRRTVVKKKMETKRTRERRLELAILELLLAAGRRRVSTYLHVSSGSCGRRLLRLLCVVLKVANTGGM
jgi:hypothetical protein